MDDLLKNAIADAKQVRDTALANAKLALTEEFSPKLQQILAAKIQKEVDELEEQPEDEEDEEDVDDELEDEPGDEIPDDVGADVSDEIPDDVGADVSDEIPDDIGVDVGDEPGEEIPDELDDEEDEEEDELDLEAILRELDADEVEDVDEPVDDEVEDEVDETIKSDDESVTEEEKEDEFDLEEILREFELEEDEEDADSGVDALRAENARLQDNLSKHRRVIEFMRNKLNEVNLLNAKLLFTNKLFKAADLTESQKLKVLESLDRALNVREAKLVYSTLAESFGVRSTSTKDKSKKKITESRASKLTKSTKPVTKVITEGFEQRQRFQKLANIKNDGRPEV